MGGSTKILINNHAKTKEVFDVILKITGNEFIQKKHGFIQKKHGKDKKIDFNQPSSEENSWRIEPAKNLKAGIKTPETIKSTSEFFYFVFQDIIGNQHSSLFFFEGYTNDYSYKDEKIMNPSSTAVWGVIGKRLVDFFGGKVLFTDHADSDDPNSWYVCDNPKYPPRTAEQTSNDRYYLYHNLLNQEPIITSQELKNMETKCSYWTDEDKALSDYLEKYEAAIKLTKELKENKEIKNKNLKL